MSKALEIAQTLKDAGIPTEVVRCLVEIAPANFEQTIEASKVLTESGLTVGGIWVFHHPQPWLGPNGGQYPWVVSHVNAERVSYGVKGFMSMKSAHRWVKVRGPLWVRDGIR
jgi:hypothetical protein